MRKIEIFTTLLALGVIWVLLFGFVKCVSYTCVKEGHSGRLRYDVWAKVMKCEEDL